MYLSYVMSTLFTSLKSFHALRKHISIDNLSKPYMKSFGRKKSEIHFPYRLSNIEKVIFNHILESESWIWNIQKISVLGVLNVPYVVVTQIENLE